MNSTDNSTGSTALILAYDNRQIQNKFGETALFSASNNGFSRYRTMIGVGLGTKFELVL